jgi:tetratricopeptide (TPR) repeat protein
MGEDSLTKYTEGARINSDNYPLLEYFDYPYLEFFPSESFHIRTVYENLLRIQNYREEVTPFLTDFGKGQEFEEIRERLSIYNESTKNTIDGIIYSLQGKISRAIQEYGRAFEINPRDMSARRLLTHFLEYIYVNRGNELQYKGDIEGAIVSYKKALDVNPNSTLARYNLALTYLRKGQRQDAKVELKKVLEIDPEMRGAQKLLDQLGNWEY